MQEKVLPRSFYERAPDLVARAILGNYLKRTVAGKSLVGKIVEVEAYFGFSDPASHAFVGMTPRTEVLFGPAGFSYIYSIHNWFCLDIVTENTDTPHSILIRALEPISGIEQMKTNRQSDNILTLTNGPGKLCQALALTRAQNGLDVTDINSGLVAIEGENEAKQEIVITRRIGVTKSQDSLLRFYLKHNNYVSKKS